MSAHQEPSRLPSYTLHSPTYVATDIQTKKKKQKKNMNIFHVYSVHILYILVVYLQVATHHLLVSSNSSMSTLEQQKKEHKRVYHPHGPKNKIFTCAATFPLPIFRSFRTTNTILYSPVPKFRSRILIGS